jgi:hypothetical protein
VRGLDAKPPFDQNRDSRGHTTYTLGPLPWSEEVLRKAYFQNFLDTRKAIQEHQGFPVHRDLSALRLSLDIFIDSVSDLIESIEAFHIESRSSEFWTRPARRRLKKHELGIHRRVFTAATAAMSVVGHSREVSHHVQIPGYQERINVTFEKNERHKFIQYFRNCLNHQQIIKSDTKITWSDAGKQTEVLLNHDELLLASSEWPRLARSFIIRHPEGIDVEILFKDYQAQVEDFHNWFHAEVQRASEPDLSEYRKYERILNRFDTNAWWNLILKQVVMGRGLNPYKYLDRYLTKPELDEILSLPMRSQNQVDRIIEILDEYGACDDELRETVYSAFGVDVPDRKT